MIFIFERYDFADGVWLGDDNWTITDNPGNGIWYYAVTSIEHSGLESHTLSNIYRVTVSGASGASAQTAAYPSEPGGVASFYTALPAGPSNVTSTHRLAPATALGQYTITWEKPADPKDIIRYFNIYAEDGAAPAIEQQNRIASIAAACDYGTGSYSYVDWLGHQGGISQYAVTAVDYQGNESIVGADTTPPEVTLISPHAGDILDPVVITKPDSICKVISFENEDHHSVASPR